MKKKTDPKIQQWRQVLDAAEREMQAATGRTSLNAAARRYLRARGELKRLEMAETA